MPVQRLVLVALVLVVVLGMASLVGEPPRRGAAATDRTPAPAGPTAAPGRLVSADLDARPASVRAREGDVVALRLTAPDGRVAIPELGVEEATIAGVPTVVRFSVVSPGRFAVRVGDPPRRRVATVTVLPRREQPETPAPERPEPRTPSPRDEAITARALAPALAG